MIVPTVYDPNFVWHARGVWAERIVVALHIDDAFPLLFVLADDVAENTALAFAEPFAGGIQLVLDASRDKNCRGDLGMCVRPLIARQQSLILEDGNVLETRIFLQVGDARGPHPQNALDLFVA